MKIAPWQYAVGAAAFFLAYRWSLASANASEIPLEGDVQPLLDEPPIGIEGEEQILERLRANIVKVAYAESYVPVLENPPRNSRVSPRINEYNATVGLDPGSLWCAAFVAWCVKHGLNLSGKPRWATGSVSGNRMRVEKALSQGLLSPKYVAYARDPDVRQKVKAGWVVNFGGHTEIVARPNYSPTQFQTVGGNTWSGYDNALLGVYRRNRDWLDPDVVMFYDPAAMSMIYDSPNVA